MKLHLCHIITNVKSALVCLEDSEWLRRIISISKQYHDRALVDISKDCFWPQLGVASATECLVHGTELVVEGLGVAVSFEILPSDLFHGLAIKQCFLEVGDVIQVFKAVYCYVLEEHPAQLE